MNANRRNFVGSPTEVALLEFASSKLKNIDKISEMFPKVFEVPFSSDTKFHLTIHRKSHAVGGLTMHIKGAPEFVWNACSTILINGKVEAISDHIRLRFKEAQENMCNKGYRVIAFATYLLPSSKYADNYRFNFERKNYPQVISTSSLSKADYTFIGLVALHDPPKPEVKEAITKIKQAGIKVVMITGDHSLTAAVNTFNLTLHRVYQKKSTT